jgi:hypothetical protein
LASPALDCSGALLREMKGMRGRLAGWNTGVSKHTLQPCTNIATPRQSPQLQLRAAVHSVCHIRSKSSLTPKLDCTECTTM